MNLQKAFDRIMWRVKEGGWKANDNDIQAITAIAEWINREKEESVNENRYFGKIIVWVYIQMLRYGRDNFFSEKEIQQILEQPLEYWYERFTMEMNRIEWVTASDFLGIEDTRAKDNAVLNSGWDNETMIRALEQNSAKNKLILSEKENQDILIKALNPWDMKVTAPKLNHFISELLNKYGNLP